MTALILNTLIAMALAAPKSNEAITPVPADLRALANQEVLAPIESTQKPAATNSQKTNSKTKTAETAASEPVTPSVMLPLHDPYVPFTNRTWMWLVGFGLSSQKILVTKPGYAIGRNDLSELGSLPFLNLNAGIERGQSWGDWGLGIFGSTTLKSEPTTTPTGLEIPANIQWVSYGAEATVGRRWNSWFGNTLALQGEFATVAQTSSQSDLARWSQSFTSTNTRFSFDSYLSKTQALSLSLLDKNSSYGRNLVWSLNYGVKW